MCILLTIIKVYQQNDGVAMGSPLGPVLSGIFMVKLENSLVPTLNESMTLWRHFVDGTITFVKNDSLRFRSVEQFPRTNTIYL